MMGYDEETDSYADPEAQSGYEMFQALGPDRYAAMLAQQGPQHFAAMQGKLGVKAREATGAAVYDNARDSIRTQFSSPMTVAAQAGYQQQSGGLQGLTEQLAAQRDRSLSSLSDAYAKATPSGNEKWLSVAAALLAPTETGKTSESLARALGVYAGAKGEERKTAQARAIELSKLASRYDIENAKLFGRMAIAQQNQGKPKYMAVPAGGKLVDVNAASQLPVMTPDEVRANPNVRSWRTTDGRIMER